LGLFLDVDPISTPLYFENGKSHTKFVGILYQENFVKKIKKEIIKIV
jgi:hypothetical protein